jgi:hypothetical protein
MSVGVRERLWERTRDKRFRRILRHVDTGRSSGGTLITEPVVVWHGLHREWYEAFDPGQSLLARALPVTADRQHCRYEVRDPDDQLLLGLRVSREQGHQILAADGTLVATMRFARWLRRRTRQPLLAGATSIGSVRELRRHIVIEDAAGQPAATSRPVVRSSYSVTYIVEIGDDASTALRCVALAAGILHDWTRYMYEPGG